MRSLPTALTAAILTALCLLLLSTCNHLTAPGPAGRLTAFLD